MTKDEIQKIKDEIERLNSEISYIEVGYKPNPKWGKNNYLLDGIVIHNPFGSLKNDKNDIERLNQKLNILEMMEAQRSFFMKSMRKSITEIENDIYRIKQQKNIKIDKINILQSHKNFLESLINKG